MAGPLDPECPSTRSTAGLGGAGLRAPAGRPSPHRAGLQTPCQSAPAARREPGVAPTLRLRRQGLREVRAPRRLRRPPGSPAAAAGPGRTARRGGPPRPPASPAVLTGAVHWASGVRLRSGTASGGPRRAAALQAPSPAAAAPRDTSPISARSRRCRATVRRTGARAARWPLPERSAHATFRSRSRRPALTVPGSLRLPCLPHGLCTTALSPSQRFWAPQSTYSVPQTIAFQSPTTEARPPLSWFPRLRAPDPTLPHHRGVKGPPGPGGSGAPGVPEETASSTPGWPPCTPLPAEAKRP